MEAIKHAFSTPASPSALFEAVATEAGQRAWWCKDCDVSASVGGKHHLRFVKGETPVNMHFELSELEDRKRVVWTCTENDNPAWVGSKLVWEIEAEGEGSRLNFVHEGFACGGPPYQGTVEGWPRFMDSLENYVVGKDANPL